MTSEYARLLTRTWKNHMAIRNRVKKHSVTSGGKTRSNDFPANFQKFNKMIGYPLNRNTNRTSPMTPYQIDYHNSIQKHHKVIVNKSRKIGITEAAIRSIALNCFDRYQGHDVMMVAGNELNIAREILLRLYELFQDKPKLGYAFEDNDGNKWKESDLIRRASVNGQHPIIEFKNDTRVFCFAASRSGKSQAFRGTDDIVAILLSEAAHTGMLEDQPIMNALQPNLANRDDADFILESTPNGRRGFFFHYWMDLMEGKMKGWITKEWDYHYGLDAKVLSEKYLRSEKANIRVDFNQEYCCKFTSTVSGVFREEDINILPDDAEQPQDYRALIENRDETIPETNEEFEF